jgi:type II secretory pathway component PulK
VDERRRQSGFALLMVLVLVALAGVALAGLARRSLSGALESKTAVEAMQRRWAVRSARHTLLGRAERILDTAERGVDDRGEPAEQYQNDPMPELRVECELAGAAYELVITDEQSKLNVNTALADAEPSQVRASVTALSPVKLSRRGEPGVRLRPLAHAEPLKEAGLHLPMIRAYGQLFENVPPGRLVGRDRASAFAGRITCWGDGRVNIRRAPEAVIRRACGEQVSAVALNLLLRQRDRTPYASLKQMLDEADQIDAEQRGRIQQHLTDASTSHGLWVIARGEQRDRHHLAIRAREPAVVRLENSENQNNRLNERTYTFEW